jgi:hypothetical protein
LKFLIFFLIVKNDNIPNKPGAESADSVSEPIINLGDWNQLPGLLQITKKKKKIGVDRVKKMLYQVE